jgi:hypothetical protein
MQWPCDYGYNYPDAQVFHPVVPTDSETASRLSSVGRGEYRHPFAWIGRISDPLCLVFGAYSGQVPFGEPDTGGGNLDGTQSGDLGALGLLQGHQASLIAAYPEDALHAPPPEQSYSISSSFPPEETNLHLERYHNEGLSNVNGDGYGFANVETVSPIYIIYNLLNTGLSLIIRISTLMKMCPPTTFRQAIGLPQQLLNHPLVNRRIIYRFGRNFIHMQIYVPHRASPITSMLDPRPIVSDRLVLLNICRLDFPRHSIIRLEQLMLIKMTSMRTHR